MDGWPAPLQRRRRAGSTSDDVLFGPTKLVRIFLLRACSKPRCSMGLEA